MTTFLIASGIWFWILLSIAVIVIIALVESKDSDYPYILPNVVMIVTLCLLYFLGNKGAFDNFFHFMSVNPGIVILSIIGYFLAGICWSIFKWFIYLKEIRSNMREKPDGYSRIQYSPHNNKGRIIHWMLYWPLSALWTLIDDPVRKLFSAAFHRFEGIYQGITDQIMKN